MSFPCTRCGLCCKNIGGIRELTQYDSGAGICKHFQPELGCLIYESRPLVCRIEEGYDLYARDSVTKVEYIKLNAEVCNRLQEEAGMAIEFRVRI